MSKEANASKETSKGADLSEETCKGEKISSSSLPKFLNLGPIGTISPAPSELPLFAHVLCDILLQQEGMRCRLTLAQTQITIVRRGLSSK
jgi:hypothetical protein